MDPRETIRTYRDAVAIVTGGASGIGRALSEELTKRGSSVVIADRQYDLAKEVVSQLNDSGGKATAVEADVTDYKAIERLVNDTVSRSGRLDYMFNNAGVSIAGPISVFNINDWQYIIDVNLNGVINGIQATYKFMLEQGFGHIVNTASIGGLTPFPESVAYGTTKHAIVGLSTSLRAQAVISGVFVSVLCPGVIRTPILWGGKFGRILVKFPDDVINDMWNKLKPMPPDLFAEKALDAVAKNKAIIIEPSWWKIIWWISRIAPSFTLNMAAKRYQAQAKSMIPED